MAVELNQEEVRDRLDYNPFTGALKWKSRPINLFPDGRAWKMWNTRYAGREAGYVMETRRLRYRLVRLHGKGYLAHRLAWLFMTGQWPPTHTDHINGDGLDNRWTNLRAVTVSENGRNQRLNSRNTSGVPGVCWDRDNNRWVVRIGDGNANKVAHIGRFECFLDAVSARKRAERARGYTQRHGSLV